MIDKYEIYCLADPLFYDTLDKRRAEHPDFPILARPLPEGWQHQETDTWMHYAPEGHRLPSQGWKIHISACRDDVDRTLNAVWDYCTNAGIAFKFLRGARVLMMANSKYAARGASGKLVTIYPVDEERLKLVLDELSGILDGVEGPYILSDLRYGPGPLYVRYGGFAERHCVTESGERVLAIENADGELVPDRRGPTFAVPEWVTLPGFLTPHLAARNAVTVAGLPYRIEQVLHFSNGGGVYQGVDTRTGTKVILKEGRPHAGLDAAGRDAVARLRHERDMLERLAGLDAVPALIDYFTLGDHHFLVEEFVDGTTLSQTAIQRHPLIRADCEPSDVAEYADWVVGMLSRVEQTVRELHGRGVVFGDLHPLNILVGEDDRPVLIDFEVATLTQDRTRSALAHPGFGAPPDRVGVEVDEYALACLRLGLFAPQATVLLWMHRPKVRQLAELVATTFPVRRAYVDEAVRTILGDPRSAAAPAKPDVPVPGPENWTRVRESMRRAILASATPERSDRLFPGDIAQFLPGGGINLGYGAAGVLYALATTGAGRFPDHEDWLRKRAAEPEPGTGVGFYDGLHGVAHVLDLLGHRQDALDLVEVCLRERWELLGLNLNDGLAGIGLNLLHLHETTGEGEFLRLAQRAVDLSADRLGRVEDVPEFSGGAYPHAGLLYGSSGVALLFLHAYERTGDTGLLDHAATALRQDLRRCVVREDGQLQVRQTWRTNLYLDQGSLGIGLVLSRYLGHREDPEFREALDGVVRVTGLPYYVQSGLFAGRGSVIAALGMGLRPGVPHPDPRAIDQIPRLAWHALPYRGELAFPGNQLLRLSMDLATGTAGILLALGTVLHEQPVHLPFCQPPGRTPERGLDRGEPLATTG
ncbi:class III lanthionine synthetase LanKC [Rhizohabitans arisaemae]|uniref:class III lanthionine synthetase LanKC n=1 Tax=Rhizohabitans arisaemae TaxID=2720610 RepID=UPI0024B06CBE|nr:class III lanthionine synthetase LanKC [Rhizohabitans arisaemae]